MSLRIGDRVRVKSESWYNENKDPEGTVDIGPQFIPEMKPSLGEWGSICWIDIYDSDLFKVRFDSSYCKEAEMYNYCSDFIENIDLGKNYKILKLVENRGYIISNKQDFIITPDIFHTYKDAFNYLEENNLK